MTNAMRITAAESVRTPDGKIHLINNPPLATGSYGAVHTLTEHPALATKVYRPHVREFPKGRRQRLTQKLEAMARSTPPQLPPGTHVAWPSEVVRITESPKPETADGYLMPRAPAGTVSISTLARRQAGAARAKNIADMINDAVEDLHRQEIVIGDINGMNMAVTPDDQLWLFDTDGWQFRDQSGFLHYAQGATDHYTHRSVFDRISGVRPNCCDPKCPLAGFPHAPTPSCRPREPRHDRHGVEILLRELRKPL